MELRHLKYFRAVAEEGHMTRAAEKLGIQQPPLSLQIKSLEQELGVQLFRRLPRGVELTEAGVAFFEDACGILQRADSAVSRAQRVARGEAGQIAVGFTSSVMSHPAARNAVRQFRSQYPDVSVTLSEEASFGLVSAIEGNQLDAAFIRTNVPGSTCLRVIELAREPLLLASPVNAGVDCAGPVSIAGMADLPLVLYRRSSGPKLYDRILAAFSQEGLVPRIVQEAPRVGSALNLVAAGMGSTLVPQSLCTAQREGVVYRPLAADPPLTASIMLAFRKSETSPGVRKFIRCVREASEACS
jgi:DNA-binding transcriptional LysR family regulator